MNKDEKSKIKYRMKRLAGKFCRRNRVYESFDGSVGKLIEKGYLSAYLQCLHENKNRTTELEKENAELKEQNANLIAMLKSEREVRVNDDYLKGICELEAEIGKLEGKVQDWTSEYYELENLMNNKVAKAKEIIKGLLSLKSTISSAQDAENRFSVREKAEEFLKECQ